MIYFSSVQIKPNNMSNLILPPIAVDATEWWVKPLAMLQHNWALIEVTDSNTIVYFFHDGGSMLTFNKLRNSLADKSIVVDSLTFITNSEAIDAMRRNGFMIEAEFELNLDSYRPCGPFFDGRSVEQGVYSKQGYWID
jgi:hypothetical protein